MSAPAPEPGPRDRSRQQPARKRSGRGRPVRDRAARNRPRWGLRLASCTSAVVLTAAGAGHAVVGGLQSAIDRVDPFDGLEHRPRHTAGDGLNFLVVGTDRRDKITEEQRRKYHLGGAPCHCTDTIMLVHVSADRRRASVVSIPRDSYAELPPQPGTSASPSGGSPSASTPADAPADGRAGPESTSPESASPESTSPESTSPESTSASASPGDGSSAGPAGSPSPGSGPDAGSPAPGPPPATTPVKLNAAYAQGGPALTVRTVEHMTGVRIDHYLEVDFTSFINTVDVLGGVDICTPTPVKDSHSGLDLPAGTSRLNGGEALQYVRSRHLDGAGDLGRMHRQQRFLAALVDRATDSGVLMNPVKFEKTASALLGSVRADKGFGAEQMLDLGKAMRGFTPASSEFVSVPVSDPDHKVPGIGSTVKWDEEKADKIFDAIRADRPLADRPLAGRPSGKKPHGERKEPSGGPAQREQGPGTGGTGSGATPVEVPPEKIRVRVENGTRTAGLAHRVDQQLRAAGFLIADAPANAERTGVERTVITYDPEWDRSVRTVTAALPGAELRKAPGQGPVITVTAGADFEKVHPVRAEPTPGTGPGGPEAVRGDQVLCD